MDRDCDPADWVWADGAQRRAWNILAFVVGIALWFVVGVMWKDRAIMVVHIGVFIAIVGGYMNS